MLEQVLKENVSSLEEMILIYKDSPYDLGRGGLTTSLEFLQEKMAGAIEKLGGFERSSLRHPKDIDIDNPCQTSCLLP